jgi:hypothetical protein
MEKLDKDFRFTNRLLLRQMDFKGPEGVEDADGALVGAGRPSRYLVALGGGRFMDT